MERKNWSDFADGNFPHWFRTSEFSDGVLEPGKSTSAYLMQGTGKRTDLPGYVPMSSENVSVQIYDPHYLAYRLPAEEVLCQWHPTLARWEVCKSSGLFRHVVADADIPQGSEGTCSVWTGESKPLQDSNQDIQACNGWITQDVEAGDKLYARYVPFTRRWWLLAKPIDPPPKPDATDLFMCNFTLDTTLVLGGTADATVGACSDNVAGLFGSTIVVEDVIGKFKGRAGYKGMAWKYKSDTSCNWQIVELEEQAEMIRTATQQQFDGTINDPVTGTVEVSWQGEAPVGNQTIVDRLGIYKRNPVGDTFIASYEEPLDQYNVVDGQQAAAGADECVPTNGRGTLLNRPEYVLVPAVPAFNWPVEEIIVNRDTCLRAFYDDGAKRMLLQIDPATRPGSLLNSVDNGKVRWSDGPQVEHHLTVGDTRTGKEDDNYLEIVGNVASGAPGIPWTLTVSPSTANDGDQVWIRPDNEGEFARYLMIRATGGIGNPNHYKLGWEGPGITALATIGNPTDGYWDLTFTNGLLTNCGPSAFSAEGCSETPTSDPANADFTKVPATEQDPCDD